MGVLSSYYVAKVYKIILNANILYIKNKLMVENVVFMSDILHHCFLYTLFIYEERKNSKKNNKENTLKGKVTDFLFMVNMAFSLCI